MATRSFIEYAYIHLITFPTGQEMQQHIRWVGIAGQLAVRTLGKPQRGVVPFPR